MDTNQKGFSILEVLIAIGILVMLFGILFQVFYNQSENANALRDAENVLTYLQKARNLTLASNNNSSFGVYFATSTASLFEGTAYSATSTRMTYTTGGGVVMSKSLKGNVSQVYFSRLTGEPSATGTITFIPRSGTSSKVIIIRGTGLAEIQ